LLYLIVFYKILSIGYWNIYITDEIGRTPFREGLIFTLILVFNLDFDYILFFFADSALYFGFLYFLVFLVFLIFFCDFYGLFSKFNLTLSNSNFSFTFYYVNSFTYFLYDLASVFYFSIELLINFFVGDLYFLYFFLAIFINLSTSSCSFFKVAFLILFIFKDNLDNCSY